MTKLSKKLISILLLIPFFFVMIFCCCFEGVAHASVAQTPIGHHQALDKSHHHSEKNGHQHSEGQDECSCPKHLSFLSAQPFDLSSNLSSSQLLAKDLLAIPQFEVVFFSSWKLYAKGPPWHNHRDYASIPIFLKNSNLRI